MAIEVFNRYEKKYIIDEKTLDFLTTRMSSYMRTDKYNKDSEFYNIANVYYDTKNDELIRKSIEKPVYKEKLRLRSYGVPQTSDTVFLEIKKKYNGLVNKRRTKIILQDAYNLIEEGVQPDISKCSNVQIMNEIEYFLQTYKLEPKVYITYDRKAFYAVDDFDFRVTFDTNIRTRSKDVRLDAGNHGDLLISNDLWVMEVKTSISVPVWFSALLSEACAYSSSFSKYGTEYKKFIKNQDTMNIIRGDDVICSKQFLKQHQYQPKVQSLV